MNVFVIYLNETEGMILVCANSEERAMELFKTSKWCPVVAQEIDLKNVKIDIYPTRMNVYTDVEGIEEYCISENLSLVYRRTAMKRCRLKRTNF